MVFNARHSLPVEAELGATYGRGRQLTVLNVAYPVAPVGPGAVGGAEQIVAALDQALTRVGHRSLVVACQGSLVHGCLIAAAPCEPEFSEEHIRAARTKHAGAIEYALRRWQVDLVHMHGVDFHEYLPAAGPPVLVTLHLPLSWYPEKALFPQRPGTFLHCVSHTQHKDRPAGATFLPVIENGVPLEELRVRRRKRKFVLALGRICPEKGFHIALDAASRAGIPLLIGGQIFPYRTHADYFKSQIAPRLIGGHRFLGPLGLARKRRLLTSARCLLVPSLVAETSSLVAMEALACGTPVIAFRAGALAEIVDHGKTGFLVDNEHEMAEAIQAATQIDPQKCRDAALARFSVERMIRGYFRIYHELAAQARACSIASKIVELESHDRFANVI